jgi:hypothetical protein
MRKTMRVWIGVLACAGTALAVAPGPLDGLDIPSDFASGEELAVQTNFTGFGDQQISLGGFTPGSEANGLYLAKDATNLYVGVTGNLEENGHAFIIYIDVDDNFGLFGQSELRAEGVDAPPAAVQNASREVVVDTNGTPDVTTDDTWMYGTNGTLLPCAPDFAIAVDVFGGTMSVNEYQLFDPVIFPGGIGTTDPTPDNLGDPDQLLYAVRNFIGQTAVNDGNEVLENLQAGNPYSVGGFNNTNTSGVTSVDAAGADLSTSGLEIAIPLERFLGADNFDLFVTIQDGGGSTGVFVPQMLPPTIDAMACTSGMAFALRQDLTNAVTCRAFSVSGLPTYTGVAEGDIDPAEYGLAAPQESQSCPTPYGDQDFDPFLGQISGGSELDALYAANDADNLYLGITGNVELNGNQLIVFIDTDPDDADLGTNGREPDGIGGFLGINTPGAGGAIGGMQGDALPEDISSNAVNFNFAFQFNGNSELDFFVDAYDFETKSFSFVGQTVVNSTGLELVNGANPDGINVFYNNSNEDGVLGNCFDAGSCLFVTTNGSNDPLQFNTPAAVEALARSATAGLEIVLPWAALNVDTNNLPNRIHVWTVVTGNGDFASNQALPPMRPRSFNATDAQGNPIRHMVGNIGNGPNDYSDGRGGPDRQADSFAAEYTLSAGLPDCVAADVNCSGTVDVGDIGVISNPLNFQQSPPACDRADVNNSGGADVGDIGVIASPLNFQTGNGDPCNCVTATPGVAGCGM